MTNAGYTLRLLGAFELVDAGGEVVLGAGKPLAVIAYLACATDRRSSRFALLDLLWGDVDPERARATLRQTVFGLRQRLGPTIIESDGEWLTVSVDITVDARAFLEAVKQGDNAQAVARYRGAFVPDFAAPGASDFERWAEFERLRLEGTFLASARSYLQQVLKEGRHADAMALAARLRDADPTDDEHWRARFDTLALAGRFAEITLEEQQLRAARAEEGRPLDRATEVMLRRLHNAADELRKGLPAASPHDAVIPAHPDFQGRALVFAQLLAAWNLASRGGTQRRTLIASAGLGKSRLLRELARRLAPQRARVVTATARQGERDDAYSHFADLVARVASLPGASGIAPASAAVLAGLVPSIADSLHVTVEFRERDAAEVLLRRKLAFADLLGAVCDETPLVLLLDDVQWADGPSLQTLDGAFGRLGPSPLLIVAASRSDLAGFGPAEERLTLPPLDREEVGGLVNSIASTDPAGWSATLTARLQARTGGSPFAVLQFLRLALGQSVLRVQDGHWETPDADAVEHLMARSASVQWRLEALDAADLEILTCLALGAVPIPQEQLARAAGVGLDALRAALFRLEADAFVTREGLADWSVAHDLVADGALSAAPAEMRLRCAAALGEALAPTALDLATVRRVVRLLLDGARPEAARSLAERWIAGQPRHLVTEANVATMLLGARAEPRVAAQLKRFVGRRQRWWRSRSWVAASTALATLGLVSVALLRPASLVSTTSIEPPEEAEYPGPYEIPPRVEVRNGLGRISRWRDGDTIFFGALDTGGFIPGRPHAVVRGGVAIFDSVSPPRSRRDSSSLVDVRFTLPGLPALELRRKTAFDSLTIVDATINGQFLPGDVPRVRVGPGQPIEGSVRLRYTTRSRHILYVMAQSTTWGRPEADTLTVRSLYAGAVGATFAAPIALTAPRAPGDYWIFWTHGSEPAAVWLLSGTNWKCKTPRWHDGNELAALPDSVLSRAMVEHAVMVSVAFCDETGPFGGRRLPMAGMRVEVR